MGVHGLWNLIGPVGKPVPLESLENKILAVDVSIWLHQATKGFRDTNGQPLPNAHLLGLYHRICKLLFYRIKPVFVFDGGVPPLKKQTLAARRIRKEAASSRANKATEKLISNLIQSELMGGDTSKQIASRKEKREKDMFELPSTSKDALLGEEEDIEYEETALSDSDSETESEYAEAVSGRDFNIHSADVDSPEFRALPANVQHEILTDLRETRKQNSWNKMHEMPKEAPNFSSFQVQRLLKRRKVQERLDEIVKEVQTARLHQFDEEDGFSVTESKRLASDATREYVLMKRTQVESSQPVTKKLRADNEIPSESQSEFSQEELMKMIKDDADLSSSDSSDFEEVPTTLSDCNAMEILEKAPKVSVTIDLKAEVEDDIFADVFEEVAAAEGLKHRSIVPSPAVKSSSTNFLELGPSENIFKPGKLTQGTAKIPTEFKASGEVGERKPEDAGYSKDQPCVTFSLNQRLRKLSSKAKPQASLETGVNSTRRLGSALLGSGTSASGVIEFREKQLTAAGILPLKEEVEETIEESDAVEVMSEESDTDASAEGDIMLRPISGNNQRLINIPGTTQPLDLEDDVPLEDSKDVSVPNVEVSASDRAALKPVKSFSQHVLDTKNSAIVTKLIGNMSSLGNSKVLSILDAEDNVVSTANRKRSTMGKFDISKHETESSTGTSDMERVSFETGDLETGESVVEGMSAYLVPSVTAIDDAAMVEQVPELWKNSSASSETSVSRSGEIILSPEKRMTAEVSQPVTPEQREMKASPSPNKGSPKKTPQKILQDALESQSFWKFSEEMKLAMRTDQKVETDSDEFEDVPENSEVRRPMFTDAERDHMQAALATEKRQILQERGRQERLATTITDQMYSEAQELLRLFGIPYIVAPMEAEAQCAFLDMHQLTQGTITDDSDIWLFGGRRVYKNFFNQTKYVEFFKKEDIENVFRLDRDRLICLALLTGSDYTEGLESVGPVTALEILSEFPHQGLESLKAFKAWLASQDGSAASLEKKLRKKLRGLKVSPGFPSEVVFVAYIQPEVDVSTERFSFSEPDELALKRFASEKFGWSQEKIDELLGPTLSRWQSKQSQTRIDSYFSAISFDVMHNKRYYQEELKNCQKVSAEFPDIMTINREVKMSKRVVEALNRGATWNHDEDDVYIPAEEKKKTVSRKRSKKETESGQIDQQDQNESGDGGGTEVRDDEENGNERNQSLASIQQFPEEAPAPSASGSRLKSKIHTPPVRKLEDTASLRTRLGKALLKSNPALKARLTAEKAKKEQRRALDRQSTSTQQPGASGVNLGGRIASDRTAAPPVARQRSIARRNAGSERAAQGSRRDEEVARPPVFEPVVAPRPERNPEPIPIQPEIIPQRQREAEEMEQRKRKVAELLKKSRK